MPRVIGFDAWDWIMSIDGMSIERGGI